MKNVYVDTNGCFRVLLIFAALLCVLGGCGFWPLWILAAVFLLCAMLLTSKGK